MSSSARWISELGLTAVIRQLPVAVVVVEADSLRIVEFNDRARDMAERHFGRSIPNVLTEAIGIFHPDGRPYAMEEWPLVRSITAGEEVEGEEYVTVLADGSKRLVRCNSSPIYDETGEIVAGVLVMEDVTGQRRMEEQLVRHASLLENVEDAVVTVDRESLLTGWNRGAEEMYGWSLEEVMGKPADLVPMDLSEEERARIRREVLEHGRWRGEATVTRKDGSAVTVDVIAVAMRDGQGKFGGYLAIHRDITERKRGEERLREANERSEAILESITDTFGALDADWRYTYVNQRALDLFRNARSADVALEDLIGRSIWELFPELVGTSFDEDLHRAMREQETVVFEAYSRTTGRWVQGRAHPHEGGLLVFGRGITEDKLANEHLAYHAQLLDNMEDAVLATDETFVLTAWNRGAERMFGWAATEALGRAVFELIPTSYSEDELASEMESLVDLGRWRGEATWYGKGGKAVYAEAKTTALRSSDGAVTGYLCIMRDLGERQRARKELEMRARQQALLAELTLRNLVNGELQALLDDAVALLARTLEVDMATIAELLPGGTELGWRAAYGWGKEGIAHPPQSTAGARSLVGFALMADEPVVSDDVRADERFEISRAFAEQDPVSALAVVIPVEKDRRFGVLTAASREHRSFSSEDVDFARAMANIVGLAVERSRVAERLEEVRENERRRVARDLHDDALSELAGALAQATLARSSSSAEETERWSSQILTLRRVGQQLRGAIYDLRLGAEEDRPWVDLLRELVAHHAQMALDCEVELRGQEAVPTWPLGKRGSEVLHIVGEAITNAHRHSGASTIIVDAGQSSPRMLRLTVSDDGKWRDPSPVRARGHGTGITGMTERAGLLGANLRIEPRAGAGTAVSLEVQLEGGR